MFGIVETDPCTFIWVMVWSIGRLVPCKWKPSTHVHFYLKKSDHHPKYSTRIFVFSMYSCIFVMFFITYIILHLICFLDFPCLNYQLPNFVGDDTATMIEWTCVLQYGQVSWGTKRSGSWARLWKGLKSWPSAETSNQGDMQYLVWLRTFTRVYAANKRVYLTCDICINNYQYA